MADEPNIQAVKSGALEERHLRELVRSWQRGHELEADGQAGPLTRAAIDRALAPGEPGEQSDGHPGMFDGPLPRLPATRAELVQLFGDPGTVARPNKAWAKANIVTVRDLPLVPAKWYFQVHRLAEPYMREAFRRARLASPTFKLERAGCFNLRHVRHDPARPLSMHSWGTAVDIDPALNGARTFERGKAPTPWGPEWMNLWPRGVPEGVVRAFRSCGFRWGGDWNQPIAQVAFVDPQHFDLWG